MNVLFGTISQRYILLFLVATALCIFGKKPEIDSIIQEHMDHHIKLHGPSRLLQSKDVQWKPLRLHFQIISEIDPLQSPRLIQTLSIALSFFAANLLVQRQTSEISFESTGQIQCINWNIPQSISSKSFDADMVFFVTTQPDDFLAAAGSCAFDKINHRPIFGIIAFGSQFTSETTIDDILAEKLVETTLHEIIHGLGFSSSLFTWYYDSATGKPYNQVFQQDSGILKLQTPRLLKLARYYFDCDSIDGVPMENEGGSGTANSHLERALFNNEIMTGSDMTGDFLFSMFTFTILLDSGWYQLSNIKPDVMQFGKFKGCTFFNQLCLGGEFPEYCYESLKQSCSFDSTGLGQCMNDPLGNGCFFIRMLPNFDCRDKQDTTQLTDRIKQMVDDARMSFGYDSLCFTGSISTNLAQVPAFTCYKQSCSLDMNHMLVQAGSNQLDCVDGATLTVDRLNGALRCPANVKNQCSIFNECPNQCNQNGYCTNRRCYCRIGFSGVACEQTCGGYRYNSACLDKCPANTFVEDLTLQCLTCSYGCAECDAIDDCQKCQQAFKLVNKFCERDYSMQTDEDKLIQRPSQSQEEVVDELQLGWQLSILIVAISIFQ